MSRFPTAILVGIDAGGASSSALATARDLASATGSPLHLVHVVLTSAALRGRPMNPAQREFLEREAQAMLESIRDELAAGGTEVAGTHVRFGRHVHSELAAAQEEVGAGILVVGARRTGTLASSLLPATPTRTLRASPGSILVVRG